MVVYVLFFFFMPDPSIALPSFFFFNDTATTEIYTLSLHDALPIYRQGTGDHQSRHSAFTLRHHGDRSEEHTSELQSPCNIVCRLLLEKKKSKYTAPSRFANRLENRQTASKIKRS